MHAILLFCYICNIVHSGSKVYIPKAMSNDKLSRKKLRMFNDSLDENVVLYKMIQSLPLNVEQLASNELQELIRRWDSERELFYDHIVQYFKI